MYNILGETTASLVVESGGLIDPALSIDPILQINSRDEFPEIGLPNVLYIEKKYNKAYRWDALTHKYYNITPDEITFPEATSGSLLMVGPQGQIKTSRLVQDSLVEAILKLQEDVSNIEIAQGAQGVVIENSQDIVPGRLIVTASPSIIKSTDISIQELMDSINDKVEISSNVVPGSLMIADKDGNLECCKMTFEELIQKIDDINSPSSSIDQVQSDWNANDESDPAFIKNKPEVLDSITLEKVGAWDGLLTHNHDDIYVKSESIFDSEGIILPSLLPYSLESGGLTLGTTARTAFRGDLGNIAYEHTKKTHAPATAQENIIEGISVNGELLPIEDKVVDIPIASADQLGLVKSSDEMNKVTIESDGTMSISKIDFSIIRTASDTEILLDAGNSNPRR